MNKDDIRAFSTTQKRKITKIKHKTMKTNYATKCAGTKENKECKENVSVVNYQYRCRLIRVILVRTYSAISTSCQVIGSARPHRHVLPQVRIRNCISICFTVSAGLMIVINRQTDRRPRYSVCSNRPHMCYVCDEV